MKAKYKSSFSLKEQELNTVQIELNDSNYSMLLLFIVVCYTLYVFLCKTYTIIVFMFA